MATKTGVVATGPTFTGTRAYSAFITRNGEDDTGLSSAGVRSLVGSPCPPCPPAYTPPTTGQIWPRISQT